jgi:Arc/MetJ-type ribon-helix-helix transcriptional regulator
MEVHLSADQQAFVRQVVASGRLQGEEEAVQEAFALWEERERRRIEILAGLDAAELDIASGRYSDYTDEMLPQLGEDLKREARVLRDAGTKG